MLKWLFFLLRLFPFGASAGSAGAENNYFCYLKHSLCDISKFMSQGNHLVTCLGVGNLLQKVLTRIKGMSTIFFLKQ